jgi:hypothetical protein
MNQEPDDCAATYLRLQGFAVGCGRLLPDGTTEDTSRVQPG